MSWRCKHCIHSKMHRIQDRLLVYCPIRKQYPSPRFIEAWGCDDYEDRQLHLFEEERRKDK